MKHDAAFITKCVDAYKTEGSFRKAAAAVGCSASLVRSAALAGGVVPNAPGQKPGTGGKTAWRHTPKRARFGVCGCGRRVRKPAFFVHRASCQGVSS